MRPASRPAPALCPTCRERPGAAPWRPFCSERCKLIDLGRWLSEDYRMPAEPVDLNETDEDDTDGQSH
jgi:endogenous inhibitor of DNA gyrase (YacG/DUF329 family)